jgi:hypothetical protein
MLIIKPPAVFFLLFLSSMEFIVALTNGVELSENAAGIMAGAEALARQRGHHIIGSEHVIYVMIQKDNRAMQWIANTIFPEDTDAVLIFRNLVTEWLKSRVIFAVQPEVENSLVLSEALNRSIAIAAQIGSGPVRDGDIVYHNGLIASEFLLAGILVEGTGLGAEALTRNSRGRVNSYTILEALGLDPKEILRPDAADGAWSEFILDPTSSCSDDTAATSHWNPFDSPTPVDIERNGHLPAAPTHGSNWLIPNHLIIGSEPSERDARDLAAAGIDTFVCLIKYHGAGPNYHRTHRYPAVLEGRYAHTLHFVHFPIRDFHITSTDSLNRLVAELKRRVLEGKRVYIHCAGGHG